MHFRVFICTPVPLTSNRKRTDVVLREPAFVLSVEFSGAGSRRRLLVRFRTSP